MNEAYVCDLLSQDARIDGRKFDEFRKIKLTYDVSMHAEASVMVEMGETKVMVGVKMDLGTPFSDTPDEGILIVNAELTPLASPEFESGPPSKEAIELARVVDRGIRESKAIDFKKLCVKKGEQTWMVFVDIYPLNHKGNLIDASALGALAALSKVKIPKIENDKVVTGEWTAKKVPLVKKPVCVTFYKVKDKLMVDPLLDEEKASIARLSVTCGEDKIFALQLGSNEKGFKEKELNECFDKAFKISKKLRDLIK